MRQYNKEIIKTWKGNGNNSIVLTIPFSLSKGYGLEKPTHVILEARKEGILIKKLDLEGMKNEC